MVGRLRLRAARDEGDASRELPFYLGVCLLGRERAEEAAVELRRAVKKNARLGEDRWFLAQLALGRGDDALKQLKKAATLPGPFRARARELAATVEATLQADAE